MKQLKLVAEKRETTGSAAAGRIRRDGLVPGVVYGESGSQSLTLNDKELRAILRQTAGHAALIDLEVKNGKDCLCVVADFQRRPLKDDILHVDFHEVSPKKKMTAHIPVRITGVEDCVGVNIENGVLEFPTHSLEVRCLPKSLPEEIVIDIADLHVNHAIHVKDLPAEEGVEYLASQDLVIVACSAMKVSTEQVVETEEAPASEATPEAEAK